MIEASVRDHLDVVAPRTMVVLEPLKVTIVNHTGDRKIDVPDFPKNPERGQHVVALTNTIYIGNIVI